MGQHPTQVGTTALAGANLLPADLLAACAFIWFACTTHFKASTKRVTWAGEGANTKGIAKDEVPGLLAEQGGTLQHRAGVQRGRGARAREAHFSMSAASKPL